MPAPPRPSNFWSRLFAGFFKTPQQIYAASLKEKTDQAVASSRFFGLPVDANNWDAPARLSAPNFIGSTQMLKQWDRADWAHSDGRLRVWAAMFQEAARSRSIPLYVHCVLRDEKTQNELLKQGRTKARYPSSAHNTAQAVDVVHGVYHWDMTAQEWKLLHKLGLLALERLNARLPKDRKLSLTWGGNWDFYDPAHWEISDFRARSQRLPVAEPLRLTPRGVLTHADRHCQLK